MSNQAVKVTAIIPAAGTSTRMGLHIPKPLLEVCGKPIINWTLDALSQSEAVDDVVIMVPEDHKAVFEKAGAGYRNVSVEIGGASRQESVKKGIDFINRKRDIPDLVLIHDAARCLVTAEMIQRSIERAKQFGAVTVAVPVTDSIAEASLTQTIYKSIDRSKLWAIQTPQVFRFDLIKRGHDEAALGATDDASLVAPFFTVHIERGDVQNLKVTTPTDLIVAEQILKTRAKS
jgi:2-C-methyl-D-erythritol 4-phosphate cytidylyltransferase